MIRSFHHHDFPLAGLLELKRESVTVVLPAREVADTVEPIVEALLGLEGLIDQLLVIDAASEDGTAQVAERAGAQVIQEAELAADLGPVLGKGDAMWRSLEAVDGELVAFVDADTQDFSPQFVTGLLGPLLFEPDVQFVKATYARPFTAGDVTIPGGGGRVSQLTARPLLERFYPELAAIEQPLAGEVAARRSLLDSIPFATGYAVEMAMLLEVHRRCGAGAIAQVDIGERRQPHQPLDALRPMASAVLDAVCARLAADGVLDSDVELSVRPPRTPR